MVWYNKPSLEVSFSIQNYIQSNGSNGDWFVSDMFFWFEIIENFGISFINERETKQNSSNTKYC